MGRRKSGRGGIQSRRLRNGKEMKEKNGEERLPKILVHTTKLQGYKFWDLLGELYTIDLVRGEVIPCPHALPRDFGLGSIAVLGSHVYVLGGYCPQAFEVGLTEEEVNKNSDNNIHCFAGSSCLDLNDDSGSGWKPAPPLKYNPTYKILPICFALCGKLFAYGCEFIGEYLDPKRNSDWCQLLPPPDSGITRFNLSEPVVRDPSNNRFLAHFKDTQALYAYYPDDDKWQLLHPQLNCWTPGVVYFDGVLYFYFPKLQHVIGAAFDVETKQWLDITFTSTFDHQYTKHRFDALLSLGHGTLCLVAYETNHFKTYVDVLKFRVSRTTTPGVIFTPISTKRYTIPTRCKIHNYAAI